MNLFNLTNVIEKPTRITEHSSTLLDPIIISDSVHYSYSDVLKVSSDISIAITYSDNFGWNALPCDSEECLGEGITHFINILQVGK
jgi:hypothetical protein